MISLIGNLVTGLGRRLAILGDGLGALAWLLRRGAPLAMGPDRGERLAAFAQEPPAQRRIFALLRAFKPTLSLSRRLMQAYDNTGTVILTRRADCLDALHRDADFGVVYGARMRKLTGSENFFLGMQPGWDYTRDTSAMHLAARTTDVAEIVAPRAAERAARAVAESGGRIDVVPALTLDVPWDMTAQYFGVGGERERMQDWTTILFWYLFEDLAADPALDTRAMDHAAALRAYLDRAIADRKAAPTDAPDLLNRCLALQAAGTPGMDDLGIRNNLLGLLIGAIPTISKASCYALDALLDRPDALRGAQRAARAGDDDAVANHVWEALRFTPHNPVIYRRALRDAVIAPSTGREIRVRKGQMVFAATFSAMFDRHEIEAPDQFRTNRRWEDYIIWGKGMHTCFGAQINRAVIPAILKPLLARTGLRRADGDAGRIDAGGTPHPQHFHLEFDPD